MATALKLRRGTTTQHATFTGAEGEITVDTTKDTAVVHDGTTAGGFPLVTETGTQTLTNKTIAATTISASGVATFSAGSAGAPAITTTGDTNTGMFFPAADTIAFAEGGTEAMRIDSSGNLGLGVTPSNWNALGYVRAIEINNRGAYIAGTSNTYSTTPGLFTGNNAYFDDAAGVFKYVTTNASAQYLQSGNTHIWYNAPVGTAGNNITFTQAMSLDTSGNLSLLGGIALNTNQGPYWNGGVAYISYNNASNFMSFGANSAERMRIDANGNLGVGTNSPSYKLHVVGGQGRFDVSSAGTSLVCLGTGSNFQVDHATSGYATLINSSNTGAAMIFKGSSESMRITTTGEVYIAGTTDRGAFNLQCNGTGVWGAGAYTNGSDKRIKNNVKPLATGLDVVAKLNPVTYKYNEDWSKDQSTQTGFIAQELLIALDGKDYVDGIVNQSSEYMSVAYQNIIPILTKAIQEQQALIASLTARLDAAGIA
jgi:hypothetical protein